MTEPNHPVTRKQLRAASVSTSREETLSREFFSESAIYGLILVSSMLLVVGRADQSSWQTFYKVLGTVIVFWIAHVFAHVVANLSDGGVRDDSTREAQMGAFRDAVRHALAHSKGLLIAAVVPLAIIATGALSILASDTATVTALWADVVLLGILGYFGSRGWTRKPLLRLTAAVLTALLGVIITLLKAFIH